MKRVLVVDDEEHIREIAATSLEVVGGWDVRTAADGEDAVSAARRDPPDAILMDVMMPGMDGPATLAALRAEDRTRDIPVVFLTAKVQASEVERLSRLGAVGVLSKPFDPLVLHDEMANLLGWE